MASAGLANSKGQSPHVSAQGEDRSGLQTDLLQTSQGGSSCLPLQPQSGACSGSRVLGAVGASFCRECCPAGSSTPLADDGPAGPGASEAQKESHRDAGAHAHVSQASAASTAQPQRRDCEGEPDSGTPQRSTLSQSGFSSCHVLSTQSEASAQSTEQKQALFWNSSAFPDPAGVGKLITGSSAFSKSSLNIWKFLVHVLLTLSFKDFEHCFASV